MFQTYVGFLLRIRCFHAVVCSVPQSSLLHHSIPSLRIVYKLW